MSLAQYSSSGGGGGGVLVIVYVAIVVLIFAAFWRVFTKAGQPGWAGIIPIYNLWVLLKIVGRPGWWLILYIVPLVNVVILIIVNLDLAKSFGKSVGFAVGLILLPVIFLPILAWGDARYVGPSAGTSTQVPPRPA